MKAFILGVFATLLSVSVSAEPVMTLITLNTDDPAGYRDWAMNSAETIGEANAAMAGGLCSPRAGAEEMGDLYLWTLFDSQKTAWSADPMNPAVAAEVAKIPVNRTVRDWDTYRVVRQADTLSEKSYAWNIMVKTSDTGAYLTAIDSLYAAMQDNGFDDISMQVFAADTGRWAGSIMVSMSASSPSRLGEAMDARTESWFSEILAGLGSIREYQYGWGLACETFYAAQ